MKVLKGIVVGIIFVVFLIFCVQFTYVQIVKPWQIQRALQSGCKVIESTDITKPFSHNQKNYIASAFSRAAWLDSRYLQLAQASGLYANEDRSSTLGDLQKNSTYSAATLLIGFCFDYHK
jgi:hypothetical protein